MDPERWKQIDRLLESALDCATSERDAFLRRACGGDEQLEREVRSLLDAHDRADAFSASISPPVRSGSSRSHIRRSAANGSRQPASISMVARRSV